jgi:hypothetical protein
VRSFIRWRGTLPPLRRQINITNVFSTPPCPHMPDLVLDLCYEALFSGLPLMRLRNWQYFEWAHDRRVSPIVGLAEFNEYFDDVLRMFRTFNFAQEYVTRWPNERTTDSPAQCELRLRALRSTIVHLGPDTVHAEINRLCLLHHTASSSQLDRIIRSFILQNHDPATLPAPTHGGAQIRMSHLLGKLQRVNGH